ncbi:GntR domain-containing protein [Burkholderia sp. YI23]|nr:GntR domain-containing protein [Burkholderia sp. YI23]
MVARLVRLQARTDYVDEVYKVLLDAISDGSLSPGARITQEDIAEQLAVSRSPVLQALRLLKKDGLVRDAPGRGLLVAPLDAAWISHLYEIRGALDSLAARLAAQRRWKIDQRIIENGRMVAKGRNVTAMIEADVAFHFAVYAASGNPLIAETARSHWVHLRRVMGAVLQSSMQRKSIWDEHAAIADGDETRAMDLSERHVRMARDNLIPRVEAVLAHRQRIARPDAIVSASGATRA